MLTMFRVEKQLRVDQTPSLGVPHIDIVPARLSHSTGIMSALTSDELAIGSPAVCGGKKNL